MSSIRILLISLRVSVACVYLDGVACATHDTSLRTYSLYWAVLQGMTVGNLDRDQTALAATREERGLSLPTTVIILHSHTKSNAAGLSKNYSFKSSPTLTSFTLLGLQNFAPMAEPWFRFGLGCSNNQF
jgi:hypothetical protein